MQSGDSEQDSGSAEQPSSLPLPVPGVPWWSGIGQHQPVSSAAVKTVYLDGISTAFRPTGFVYPHLMQPAPMQIVGQTPSDSQDPSVMASTMQPVSQSGYEEANINGNQQQPVNSTALSAPSGEYYLPQTQLELGHSMVRIPYPFADPYYGGIIAAYVAQGVVHPHMLGVQQARMPLPSEMLEEEPVYVNAKQYHGILRRRQSRAKAESENKLVKVRKPYLHESRHQHAMKRERGCGGRFLNTKSKEKSSTDNSNKSPGEQSSEESCAPDSCNANSKQAMTGPQNLGLQSVTRMPGEVTGGSEQSNANTSGFTPHGNHRPMMLSGAIQGSTYNHQNQLLHSSAFRPLAGRSDEDG